MSSQTYFTQEASIFQLPLEKGQTPGELVSGGHSRLEMMPTTGRRHGSDNIPRSQSATDQLAAASAEVSTGSGSGTCPFP